MSESYVGENQPTDGAGAKFRGLRTDTGAQSEFLSPAGDGVVTEHGKRVVAQRVNQPSTIGMGLAVGTQEDAAAEGDTDGSVIAKLRALTLILGEFDDTKNIDSTTPASLQAKLRGLIEFAEFTKAVLGLTSDVSLAADQSGTINAHTRSLTKYIGDTDAAAVTTDADGSLSAKARGLIVLLASLLKAEDAAHSSGDKGIQALAVRKDTAAALAGTDGDYLPLIVDANGKLWIAGLPALGAASIAGSLPTTQAANTAVLATAVTVGTSPTALPASALANRRSLTYFNNGTVTTYVGSAAVTTSSGIPVGPGQTYSIDLGPGVTLYAISGTASQNGRVVEAA